MTRYIVAIAQRDDARWHKLSDTVRKTGLYPVRVTDRGDFAARALTEGAAAALIVDPRMPALADRPVLEEVLRTTFVPTVVVTDDAEPDPLIGAIQCGVVDWIRWRDVSPNRVVRALERAIAATDRRRTHRVWTDHVAGLRTWLGGYMQALRGGQGELPALPTLVVRLDTKIREERSMAEIAGALDDDTEVARQVLYVGRRQLAYARHPPVADLVGACVSLGTDLVFRLVVTVVLHNSFRPALASMREAFERLWQATFKAAWLCEELLRLDGVRDRKALADGYLRTLFLGVGELALFKQYHDHFVAKAKRVPAGKGLDWRDEMFDVLAEQQAYVGARLLTRWAADGVVDTSYAESAAAQYRPHTIGSAKTRRQLHLSLLARRLLAGQGLGYNLRVQPGPTVHGCLEALGLTGSRAEVVELARSIADAAIEF